MGLKNVQRNTFTPPQDGSTTFNITITAVNMAKVFVRVNFVNESLSAATDYRYRYRLTSSTNLEIYRASGMYDNVRGAYEIIEFD